jgi:hypothetical protein
MQISQTNPTQQDTELFLLHEGGRARLLTSEKDADLIRKATFDAPSQIEPLISPDLVDAESLRPATLRLVAGARADDSVPARA